MTYLKKCVGIFIQDLFSVLALAVLVQVYTEAFSEMASATL